MVDVSKAQVPIRNIELFFNLKQCDIIHSSNELYIGRGEVLVYLFITSKQAYTEMTKTGFLYQKDGTVKIANSSFPDLPQKIYFAIKDKFSYERKNVIIFPVEHLYITPRGYMSVSRVTKTQDILFVKRNPSGAVSVSDVICIYLGALPGDVLQYVRTGEPNTFRHVIGTPNSTLH